MRLIAKSILFYKNKDKKKKMFQFLQPKPILIIWQGTDQSHIVDRHVHMGNHQVSAGE